MSFVNQALELKEDGTFKYNYSSDDLNSNKKGVGKYQVENKNLILKFSELEMDVSSATENKASLKFSEVIRLLVQDTEGQPLIGVTLTLREKNGKVLLNGISNEKGNCVLKWKKGQKPAFLEASYTGFSNLLLDVPDKTALDYTIKLSHTYKAIEAGTIWEFDLKTWKKKIQLTKDERATIFFKRIQQY